MRSTRPWPLSGQRAQEDSVIRLPEPVTRHLSMVRILAASVLLVSVTGCGGDGGSTPSKTVRLKPGVHVLRLGGRVNVGDRIACVTANGAAAGGGTVPKAGHGFSRSDGVSVMVSSSGRVRVTCPQTAGNS